MADWSKPTLTSTYTNFLSELNGRLNDLAVGMDTSATNIPTNTLRWSSANNKWQKWNGTAWVDLATQYAINVTSATQWTTGRTISLTGDVSGTSPAWNGTANLSFSTTLATVNSNVGTYGSSSAVPVITVDAKGRVTAVSTAALASMAVQNSSNVNITGGSISGVSLDSSSVTITGGSISNTQLSSGNVNFTGGSISGVSLSSSNVNITGGSISGVSLSSSNATITGGSISNLSSPLAIDSGGTGASTWQTALAALGSPLSTYIDRSSNFTIGLGDKGKLFGCTNTITATLPTASSVGQGFVVGVRNNGSGTITIARSGSDTIDGATSVQLFSGTSCIVVCTGTGWYTIGRQQGGVVNVQLFPSSGTWYKPAVGTMALIECWGGGGGGCRYSGGGGGNYCARTIPLADLPSTVAVTVGAGGSGTSTSSGYPGGNTTFGSFLIAHGGGNPSMHLGGGGGGAEGYSNGTGHLGRYGGANGGNVFSSTYGGGGGGSGSSEGASDGNTSMFGGGGGGGSSSSPSYQGLGGVSIYGGNGGNGAYGNASSGSVPGGGGGGSYTGTGGAGGNGYCRVTVF